MKGTNGMKTRCYKCGKIVSSGESIETSLAMNGWGFSESYELCKDCAKTANENFKSYMEDEKSDTIEEKLRGLRNTFSNASENLTVLAYREKFHPNIRGFVNETIKQMKEARKSFDNSYIDFGGAIKQAVIKELIFAIEAIQKEETNES